MIRGSYDNIERIIDGALELFVHEHLLTDAKGELEVHNQSLVLTIINIISDAGIIHLSTRENVIDLWEKIRMEDKYGVADWLLQTAVTWRIRTTTTRQDYDDWCSHIAESYGQQNPSDKRRHDGNHDGTNVCVDDDTVDRMALETEFKQVLVQNPWFTYLVTLQLSWHRIFNDLTSSGFYTSEGE